MALKYFLASVVVFSTASAFAADPIGEIDDLDGDARASGPAGERALDDGDDIFLGDTIITSADSAIEIAFNDDTAFSIGEQSTVTIDTFIYSGGANDRMVASIATGAMRFISGAVAKAGPDAMTLTTPVATIGVRGTTAAIRIEGETGEYALLEPERSRGPTAIRVSNEAGAVTVDQPNHVTRVPGRGLPPTPPEPLSRNAMDNLLGAIRAGVTRVPVIPNFR